VCVRVRACGFLFLFWGGGGLGWRELRPTLAAVLEAQCCASTPVCTCSEAVRLPPCQRRRLLPDSPFPSRPPHSSITVKPTRSTEEALRTTAAASAARPSVEDTCRM
jgi:hypothetical protein